MIMLESSEGGGREGGEICWGGGGETRFAPPLVAPLLTGGGAQLPLGAETPLKIKAFTFPGGGWAPIAPPCIRLCPVKTNNF